MTHLEPPRVPTRKDGRLRTGLVRQFPPFCLVADIDDTLTHKGKVPPEIMDRLVCLAQLGIPVCFISARDLPSIIRRVVDPLVKRIPHPYLLQNIVVIGEMSEAILTYRADGTSVEQIDLSAVTPAFKELKTAIKSLPRFLFPGVALNEKKQVMITLEKTKETSDEAPRGLIPMLKLLIERLVEIHGQQGNFWLNETPATISLVPKGVDKIKGVQIVVRLLKERGIYPQKYIALGDNDSDLQMKDGLEQIGKQVQFFYVGEQPLAHPAANIEVLGGYTEGTKKALDKIIDNLVPSGYSISKRIDRQ